MDATFDYMYGIHDMSSDHRAQCLPSQAWQVDNDDNAELQNTYHTSATSHSTAVPSTVVPRRHHSPTVSADASFHTSTGQDLAPTHNVHDTADLLPSWQHFTSYRAQNPRGYSLDSSTDGSYDDCSFPLQPSPPQVFRFAAGNPPLTMQLPSSADHSYYMPMSGPMESMGTLAYHLNLNERHHDVRQLPNPIMHSQPGHDPTMRAMAPGNSPASSILDVCSLSSSDRGWTAVNMHHGVGPAVFNPGQTLHIRSSSASSNASPSDASYEDMPFPMHSPISDHNSHSSCHDSCNEAHHHSHDFHSCSSDQGQSAAQSPEASYPNTSPPQRPARTVTASGRTRAASASSKRAANGPASAGKRRRSLNAQSVIAKNTKSAIKKTESGLTRKTIGSSNKPDCLHGRRRGPLNPEQRAQAHEIRKMRACIRCKFLKKTCDKGEPCAGCRPSHARLWQVPCTRIDIKELGFFVKDWECDYKRHVNMNITVTNIKGYNQHEHTVYITHGFGHFLPINAREVYVLDETCFQVDWIEPATMTQYDAITAKWTVGYHGISLPKLSEYVESHLDNGFEKFVNTYFEGTPFVTQMLQTAYRYYARTKTPVIRQALKLVLAYTLTVHITFVQGMPEKDQEIGKVDDRSSRFYKQTAAPSLINIEIKSALAKMWRELQAEVLQELSRLYSSVYQGDKLRHWPTILMVALILLSVWELMQFDCHYREPDDAKVDQFCNDMESTPVGVIVGLFQAISQKLPSFMEWETSKHSATLNHNGPICDAMTEVRKHVEEHEAYLRARSTATFSRENFDCLSNKLLSRLVIRAH